MVVGIETNGVMFATTSKLGWSTGYHGELGRIFGLLSLLQTNGKRVPSDSSFFVPFRDFLHICPAFCLFFSGLLFVGHLGHIPEKGRSHLAVVFEALQVVSSGKSVFALSLASIWSDSGD